MISTSPESERINYEALTLILFKIKLHYKLKTIFMQSLNKTLEFVFSIAGLFTISGSWSKIIASFIPPEIKPFNYCLFAKYTSILGINQCFFLAGCISNRVLNLIHLIGRHYLDRSYTD